VANPVVNAMGEMMLDGEEVVSTCPKLDRADEFGWRYLIVIWRKYKNYIFIIYLCVTANKLFYVEAVIFSYYEFMLN
jgi:hypothetical protein